LAAVGASDSKNIDFCKADAGRFIAVRQSVLQWQHATTRGEYGTQYTRNRPVILIMSKLRISRRKRQNGALLDPLRTKRRTDEPKP
jgi:hypothetical protein